MSGKTRRSAFRTVVDWLLVCLLFAACGLLVTRLDEVSTRTARGSARVIDGDTLAFGRERVRLRGIDAFERDQTCRRGGEEYACGREAMEALAAMVRNGPPNCSGRTTDRYGRLLAICEAGGRDLNAAMVASGWAVAYGAYRRDEDAAREAGRGAWSGEFALPSEWRAGRGEPYEPPQDWLRVALDLIVQLWTGRGGKGDEAL